MITIRDLKPGDYFETSIRTSDGFTRRRAERGYTVDTANGRREYIPGVTHGAYAWDMPVRLIEKS